MGVDVAEAIRRVKVLPDRYAGRVRQDDLDGMRAMAGGGEWRELAELLVASLNVTQAAVTDGERDELRSLLAAMGVPGDPAATLNVKG